MGTHAPRPARSGWLASCARALAVAVLGLAGLVLFMTFIAILVSP